jgi:arabinogalactan oligomer / maltooligosaccharide transport system substrate-binding protein
VKAALRLFALVAVLGVLAALAACGQQRERGVVLWHAYTGQERAALEQTAATYTAAHPETPIVLVAVPYDSFADKLSSAIPRGNGPDLFIYPHDRIGDWADAGTIEPIEFWVDDARADRFTEQAIGAMAYRGSLYGLPVSAKSIALFVRTDLVKTPTQTTDDILKLAPEMRARNGYALGYPNGDLYFHAALLHGFGGAVMDDEDHLSIATPEAANAMTYARSLVVDGVSPADASEPLVATLFNEGKAATVMSGPWFVTQINANVPWEVRTLPVISQTGLRAAPFLGAEGILMSSHAHDKQAAFAVMDALTSDDAAIIRAKVARQVVANIHAYDDADIAKDPALKAFREQLDHTVPMPKSGAMRMVWTPYKTALGEVLSGRAQAGEQLLSVEKEVKSYLREPAK